MNVPAIGKTKGIFEIFVPGVFLLINLTGVLYLLSQNIKPIGPIGKFIKYLIGQPSLIIVVLICFGYLIGMILRLLMTEPADLLSAWYHRKFDKKNSRNPDGSYKLWSIERFPYIGFVGELIIRDISDQSGPVYKFYETVWEPRNRKKGNRRFFNFCKTMLVRDDNQLTVMELYTAESINRYISGMFYSLAISSILILIALPFQRELAISLILLFVLLSYFIGLLNIVSRFRFIRIKEVQTLFDACYKNKEWFLNDKGSESSTDQIDDKKI